MYNNLNNFLLRRYIMSIRLHQCGYSKSIHDKECENDNSLKKEDIKNGDIK